MGVPYVARIGLSLLLALSALTPLPGWTQEAPKPAEQTPPGPRKEGEQSKPKLLFAKGEVSALDAKAGTLTVNVRGQGQQVFQVGGQSVVLQGREKKGLTDLTKGLAVIIRYTEESDRRIARFILIHEQAASAPPRAGALRKGEPLPSPKPSAE